MPTHPGLMISLTPTVTAGRKEQLTYLINVIFIVTGVAFLIHDYFSDYRVDGYWSMGSIREVELIVFGTLVIGLLRMGFVRMAKLITSLSLPLIFCLTPVFITLNYLEMYYINTLLLPVIAVIPSLVYTQKENRRLILSLFVLSLLINFAAERIVFGVKHISAPDLDFYNYHFVLFSMAKVFTSVFIFVNVTRIFRQNEFFESRLVSANEELKAGNELIQSQKQRIEEQNLALKKSAEELKNLDEVKSTFFANISHEFRTPLTLLLGPLQEEVNRAPDAVSKERFGMMKRSATRLLNLVNQLLDLSKLESGSLKLQAGYGDITQPLRQIASQFMSIAESRKIEFKVEMPREVNLWYDADKVEKIVMNILGNAFKFTPSGGVISLVVRTSVSGNATGWMEIEVSDSGIGIDSDKVEKIFDRFYQVNDSARREYEGTGIGLALVKELAEVHHGSVHVFSNPGQGSIFSVRLPLGNGHLKEDEKVENQPPPERSEVDLSSLTLSSVVSESQHGSSERALVLVVEDSPDLQRYLEQGMSGNYELSFASNGQEGFDLATSEQPDLIVSDLMMPKVDGITMLRMIKSDERTSHIPVILLTAKADAASRLEGIEVGADDYVAKPFEMIELKARIHNLIESRRKLREKYAQAKIIRPNEINVASADDRFMKKVLTSIESHLADDLFGVNGLAEDVSMSTVQLYRKIKAVAGTTPNDLIKTMRLNRAKSLLEQRAGNVSEVAQQTGFRNMSYFAKCFREMFGVNPSEVGGVVNGR
jgi:signal transduction histidine kinase/DNA-binding response OmpR family regulator